MGESRLERRIDSRAFLRQALYMPALVACRFNKDSRVLYQKLVEAGKPAKVAITAVMRKLVVLANALLRDNRPWAESPLRITDTLASLGNYLQRPRD